MRLAREGYPFVAVGFGLAAAAWGSSAVWGGHALTLGAFAFTALAFFTLYFFRDPDVVVPREPGAVVAPGAGRVIDVREVDEPTFFNGACRRVTIFLSVFDVHVQRAPVTGTVEFRAYRPGTYLAAWHGKASEQNERASVGLGTPAGKVLVNQIAGLVARRIVTYPSEGDCLERGARLGLIRFGSRVDLFVPLDWQVSCAVGDRAVAGVTVLARHDSEVRP